MNLLKVHITLYKNLIYRNYLNVYITRLLYGPWQAWTPYLCTLPTPRTRTTSLWGGRWRRTTHNSWPYTCGALPSSVCSHTWCIAKRFTSLYRTNVHVNMKLPVYTSSVLQIHLHVYMKGFSSPCNNTLIHYTFALISVWMMCSLPKLSFTALDSIPLYMWIFKVEFADTIFATYSLPADTRESND